MRLLLRKAALLSVLVAVAAVPCGAQDPVRLPGVNVTGKPDKPGPRVLVGIVVDTAGLPIGGAEVTVPHIRRRIYTRDDGTFRFDGVPKGIYEMRARKIGFAAQVRKFEVDSLGGSAQFSLMPLVQGLPAIVSVAARRGLSGNVADLGMQAVPDAAVRVLGIAMETKTDVQGNFFLPVETGRYMVSIAKDSFATKLVSVAIPKDSGRHVNAWLMPGGKVEKDHFWNIDDLRARQAWAKPEGMVLFTREDLARMKIEWIADAVVTTNSKLGFREPYSADCFAVINGGPEIANVEAITIDDVESVEVYPALSFKIRDGSPASPSVAAAAPQAKAPWGGPSANAPRPEGGKFVWVDNTRLAAFENRTRICPGIYVWLR